MAGSRRAGAGSGSRLRLSLHQRLHGGQRPQLPRRRRLPNAGARRRRRRVPFARLSGRALRQRAARSLGLSLADPGRPRHVPRAAAKEGHLSDDLTDATLISHGRVADDGHDGALEDDAEEGRRLALEEHRLARLEVEDCQLLCERDQLLEVEVGEIFGALLAGGDHLDGLRAQGRDIHAMRERAEEV